MGSLETTEAECAAGRTAPRVSLDDIKANIAAQYVMTGTAAIGAGVPGHSSLDVLTICILVLQNGFTIIGKSAPASADNFDAALGEKLAYEDAVRQVWPLMGYELRERMHAFARMDDLRERLLALPRVGNVADDPLPHMQRVVVERDELRDRLAKLQAFMGTPLFSALASEERADLVDQAVHMRAYLARLEIRLAR